MFRAVEGVSLGAVDKWYRDSEKGGNEISATNLLRVVLTLKKVPEFAAWLAGYGTTHSAAGSLISPEERSEMDREAKRREKEAREKARAEQAAAGRGTRR